MSESKELFTSFRPVSKAEWIKKIEEDLKGKAYSSLIWHTPDGLSVEPVHHRDDRQGKVAMRFSTDNLRWTRRQNFTIGTTEEALQAMQDLSESEFDAIGLTISSNLAPSFLSNILKEADRFNLAIHIRTSDAEIEEKMLAFASTNPQIAARLKGSLEGNDTPLKFSPAFREAFPAFYHFAINDPYGDSSSDNLVKSLVHALSTTDQIIQHALSEGVALSSIREHLLVNVRIGTDFFREIARLRAIRFLIANLFLHYDENLNKADHFKLHVEVAELPEADPYRNLLKNTTAALAALAGTADILSLDSPDQEKNFARLNRNIQLILFYENKAGRVADPYFESYYVEELSDQMAKAAWEQFTENQSN